MQNVYEIITGPFYWYYGFWSSVFHGEYFATYLVIAASITTTVVSNDY